MTPEQNGRIKLTVKEVIAWAVLLAAVLGQWYDTRTQIALAVQSAELRARADDVEHAELRKEDGRLWRAVEDAQAAPRPRRK